jgi:recombination protein RecT
MAATSSIEKLKEQTGIQKKPQSCPEMLSAYKGEIEKALPKHMSGDRMARVALTAFRQNPELAKCAPASIFAAIIVSSQLGLEIGVLGHAYLVPYKEECTLIPGWRGLVDLVSRAGKATVWTGAVYAGDEFDFQFGDSPYLVHRPGDGDQTYENLTFVYAIGRVKGAEYPVIEVWTKAKAIKHRDKHNKVGGRHYSYKYFEAYARKVALLQVLKYVPLSVEVARAYELEVSAEKGTQKLTVEGALKDAPFIEAEQPALPAIVTPYDEAFTFLQWDEQQQTEFLALHKGKSEDAIKALLQAELDRE